MRKYTVTQTEVTPNGRQLITKIQTDDEEVIKHILDGKPLKNKEAMDANFKDVKKESSKKPIPKDSHLIESNLSSKFQKKKPKK